MLLIHFVDYNLTVLSNITQESIFQYFNYYSNLNFLDYLNNFINFFLLKKIIFFKKFDYFFIFQLLYLKKFELNKFDFLNISFEKKHIIVFYFNFFFNNFFFFIYTVYFIFFINFFFNNFFLLIYEKQKNIFLKLYNNFSIIWIKFFSEKLESTEESILLFKLLPFFLFLFFSHLFFFEIFSNIIIFIEWNLPVIFGILLILENIWLFGSYIFIYLNGSKLRKIFLASLFEDIANLFILIIRILLQTIRGVIISLYHDFFREISTFFFLKFHFYIFSINLIFDFNFIASSWNLFFINVKFLLFFLTLTFTVVLMLLQALFLFLAIWLFCKCWFISTYDFKFYINMKFLKN